MNKIYKKTVTIYKNCAPKLPFVTEIKVKANPFVNYNSVLIISFAVGVY